MWRKLGGGKPWLNSQSEERRTIINPSEVQSSQAFEPAWALELWTLNLGPWTFYRTMRMVRGCVAPWCVPYSLGPLDFGLQAHVESIGPTKIIILKN